MARMTSLAYTPGASAPPMAMRRTFSGSMARHCDASTSRTCEVPMPKATAPNAPCVEVWLSPQAMVIPGWVRPSSGPMTWTMPWSSLPRPNSGTPNSRQLRSRAAIICSAIWSANGRGWPSVGTMWSTVAKVRSGNATRWPRRRSMSKACGLVTSCTRCRPIEQLRLPRRQAPDRVQVPDFLKQC